MTMYEEADEYCPHCDNQYVSERAHRSDFLSRLGAWRTSMMFRSSDDSSSNFVYYHPCPILFSPVSPIPLVLPPRTHQFPP